MSDLQTTESLPYLVRHLLELFSYSHLPESLQEASRPFHELAERVAYAAPKSPETVAGLRKLLEAKDCAVRALVARK